MSEMSDLRLIDASTPRYQMAVALHTQVVSGAISMLTALAQIRAQGLYTDLGYESFTTYAQETLGYTRQYANELIKVMDVFLLTDGTNNVENPGFSHENGAIVNDFCELGLTKLIRLSRLPDYTLAALRAGGSAEFPDGRIYTPEQIKSLTRKEIDTALRPKEKELRNLRHELEDRTIDYENQLRSLREDYEKAMSSPDGKAEILKRQMDALRDELAKLRAVPPDLNKRLSKEQTHINDALAEIATMLRFCASDDEAGATLVRICDSVEEAAVGMRRRYQAEIEIARKARE